MTEDLGTLLRESAVGGFAFQAAVELLVEHGFWLEQTDFVAQVITIHADGHATVDWGEAWAFSDQADEPESEQCVLRMACSFADPSLQVGLGEVRCLDHRNLHLIQGALYTTMFGPDAPATE
jgi:hypothetical protein